MKHSENLHSAIKLISLLPDSTIHSIIIDENNVDKYIIGFQYSQPNGKHFKLLDQYNCGRAQEFANNDFFIDKLIIAFSHGKSQLEDGEDSNTVHKLLNMSYQNAQQYSGENVLAHPANSYSDIYTLTANELKKDGVDISDKINNNVFSEHMSVAYSKGGADIDTSIEKSEFFKEYQVSSESEQTFND